MTESLPIACSLNAADLRRRLAEIAAVGAETLIGAHEEGGRHVLRFRGDASTRSRLEAIVAAEAECCSFLDLELTAAGDELLLRVGAPPEAQAIADELAAAFG